MRIRRRNGLPEPLTGRADHMTDAPARRLRWRARRRWDRGNARQAPGSATGGDQRMRMRAAPAETAPAETTAAEAAPGETMAAEAAPGETMAAEAAPGETMAAEAAPGETMAAAMQLA